ncbi:hypothetical protein EIP91_006088 [Steccherinum ochraceum]|uniref:DUF6534 domain-containing protein n=1 Tax=Steccherinum ochraceum TaxID=92696 RepID=A0A4R0RC56_9APHY|nr:hypothetical protein EIP91_006088 [Steccherinum ochraceum]
MSGLPCGAPLPDVTLQLGPMFITISAVWGMLGLLTVQLYIYHLAFPSDRIYTKLLVFGIYLLELTQVILVTYDGSFVFAVQWGDFSRLGQLRLFWFSMPAMTGLVSFPVQLFYAWRLYNLSKNYWVTAIVVLTSVLQGGFTIWDTIAAHASPDLRTVVYTINYITVSLRFAATAACDILITVFTTYYLYRAKQRSSTRRTTITLDRLIKFTAETGLLTAAFAIVEVIIFAASKHTLLYTILLGIVPKMYSNCLLAVLNSRLQVSDGRITTSMGVNVITTVSLDNTHESGAIRAPSTGRSGITISISQVTDAQTTSLPDGSIEMQKLPNWTDGQTEEASVSDKVNGQAF